MRAFGEARIGVRRAVSLANRSASAASNASTIAGRLLRKLLIGRARQHQHAGVADRDHIGGARHIGEEADLADQFAGAQFGDRREIAGPAHRERAMQHHEQGVRRLALRHQHLPAHEILADHGVKRLQPLFRN